MINLKSCIRVHFNVRLANLSSLFVSDCSWSMRLKGLPQSFPIRDEQQVLDSMLLFRASSSSLVSLVGSLESPRGRILGGPHGDTLARSSPSNFFIGKK